jgi:hypothetical protein
VLLLPNVPCLSTLRYEDTLTSHGALSLGDVTWHHGWTLHSAPPNDPWFGLPDDCGEDEENAAEARARPRLALTVSFVADGARLQAPPPDGATGAQAVVQEGKENDDDDDGGAFGGEAEPGLATVVLMDDEDRSSYEGWLKDLHPGAIADHPFLPIVWDEKWKD